ncbi:MAG: hypothetical protein ACOH5I_07090 [Oligoflexus sp.]
MNTKKWKLLIIIMGILLILTLFRSSKIYGQDIPEKGASFFDYLQNMIGIQYDGKPLPKEQHPFEVLLHKLNQYSPFFTSVIPFGRSLQKMAAYPQSSKFPRIVVASREDSQNINTHFRGRLFLGYVESTKKLEVISYNPIMGRYEFQIVENFYPGGKAQAHYVPRSLCLRCHQGGTPIFAGGDWLETTAFNPTLRDLSEAAIGGKEYFGIPLSRDTASSKYNLLPRPERFDDMVRFAALLVGYQKSWQEICSLSKDKVQCKKSLLQWMIVTNLYDKLSLEPDLELINWFVSVLGDGTINIPSEKLPDHDPIINGQLSFQMPADKDPSLPRKPMQMIMASKNDPLGLQYYKFHIFVKSMGQSVFTDKDFDHFRSLLGGRPREQAYEATFQNQTYVTPQIESTRVCLPGPAEILKVLNAKETMKQEIPLQCFLKEKWIRLTKAIDAIPFTQDEPISRQIILRKLDKELGTQYAATICCQKDLDLNIKELRAKKTMLNISSIKDQRLKGFFKFCSECHLYQDLPPPFLAGEKEEEVLQSIKNRAKLIQFRLLNKQMPPHFARHHLSPKERQDLLQDLTKIEK